MQKIRKILRAIAQKMRYKRTDGLTTDNHEFIGPFSTSWGTNKPLGLIYKMDFCSGGQAATQFYR